MTKDELLLEIGRFRSEGHRLNDQAYKLKCQLAEMECPFKIGQIMIYKRTRGWGDKKKEIVERAIIKSIYPASYHPYYKIFGVKLRRNGTESLIDAGFNWKHYIPEVKDNG